MLNKIYCFKETKFAADAFNFLFISSKKMSNDYLKISSYV